MSAHTPGPWECFYKPKYDEWHVSLPLQGQSMRLGLFDNGCPTESPEADARLIAAAPEMLAALIVARQVITTDRTAFADCSTGPDNAMEPDDAAALAEYDEALLQIDAAIHKAAGGSA